MVNDIVLMESSSDEWVKLIRHFFLTGIALIPPTTDVGPSDGLLVGICSDLYCLLSRRGIRWFSFWISDIFRCFNAFDWCSAISRMSEWSSFVTIIAIVSLRFYLWWFCLLRKMMVRRVFEEMNVVSWLVILDATLWQVWVLFRIWFSGWMSRWSIIIGFYLLTELF